jgi:hypothetical protein
MAQGQLKAPASRSVFASYVTRESIPSEATVVVDPHALHDDVARRLPRRHVEVERRLRAA